MICTTSDPPAGPHLFLHISNLNLDITTMIGYSEEKTQKNRLTETLEPHKQNTGAPKLVSRYQTHSLSPLQPTGCCQLTLEAETK